jgi:dTDP-4-dehydrorhamnose reductase
MRAYRDQFDIFGFNHADLDLRNREDIRAKIGGLGFDILINTAAFTDVDGCEKQPEQAFQVNAEAPQLLAEICSHKKATLIHVSTDYVFDGEKREPYLENDPARPISVYGESKREGEKLVLQTDERHLVLRVSWVFGPERPSFVDGMIARARRGELVSAVTDKFSTPTFTGDIVQMLPRVFDGSFHGGLLHFANAGSCSWQEYAQHALDCCLKIGVPLKSTSVAPVKLSEMKNFIARRPVYSVLSTETFQRLTGESPRSWQDAVLQYIRDFVAQ